MSVDMRNSEGYLDLTAYEAIKKVEQEQRSGRAFRPIVYICSPYAGDIAGIRKAAAIIFPNIPTLNSVCV